MNKSLLSNCVTTSISLSLFLLFGFIQFHDFTWKAIFYWKLNVLLYYYVLLLLLYYDYIGLPN